MTSVPVYRTRGAGTWAYMPTYHQDWSSSSISSVSDFSSSVEDGRKTTKMKREAGLATKINICSGSGFPAAASFKSWGFDPDEEKAKKKRRKRQQKKEGAAKAKLEGMGSPGTLGTAPTLETMVRSLPNNEDPSSVLPPAVHGLSLDDSKLPTRSSSMTVCCGGEASVLHLVLIAVLMFSIIALIIIAAIAYAKSSETENPLAETELTIKELPLHKAARKLRKLLRRY